ncbi:hypothetical protein PTTG_00931 [Puccinia triticina 1-1 BBBD Race 1]|uniref:Yeast cell wall synthesis Kre9/Knh1-like N-terminal domain-containing protein n=2 Tax=Puccinia triticina TaxID=208348 RepID=A0A180GVU4_PUCT1|nr:hypothetical protein PTTG_00931 [Puccinia triticina 1-1 BBBD Race 1]
MRFLNLFGSLAGLTASAAAFTINSPSASSYWVQFATNTIAWSNAPNDSPQVTLQIVNSNHTLLNGVFSIAEYVPAALEAYTVTNVTLVVADGYQVQMVNPANSSLVYATSSPFSVKSSDTPPAPGSNISPPSSLSGMGGTNGDMRNMTGMSGMPGSATNGRPGNTTGFNNNSNNNGTANSNARSDASSVYLFSFATWSIVASAIGFVTL